MIAPRILLVEDNPITCRLVRLALEKHGYEVCEARDGASAIKLFSERGADLILQDLVLPDIDGFALVGQLRALPGGAEIAVLAFSGMLSKGDEARVSAVGFTDMVSKPIQPARLIQIIRAHLPSGERSAEQFGAGFRLIVADDDLVQRKLVTFRLRRVGFEIRVAADGAEALELARSSAPDAIVTDVMMPGIDGFALCAAVREDPEISDIPVILVTNSYVDDADRNLGLYAGATAFLLRTPELRELLTVLRTSLDPRKATPARVHTSKPPTFESERGNRILKQLERQVALNAGISRRCASLSAEIAVLSGISDALARNHDTSSVLQQILAACLDAGGISAGVLYVRKPDGGFQVHSVGARAEWTDLQLDGFFGDLPLLHSIIEGREATAIPSAGIAPERVTRFLVQSKLKAALVLPLVHRTELGALLLVSSDESPDEDRLAFAQGVASQISLALALTGSFREKEVSERKATEHARVLDSVLESVAEGVMVADAGGAITLWNPLASRHMRAALASVGASDAGRAYGIFMPNQLTPMDSADMPIARAIQGESTDRIELFLRHEGAPDGIWISANGRPLRDEHGTITGGVMVFRDVTAERATQEQLMVSDRMASIGTLAAGVAHEINNPLASVLANLELATADVADLLTADGRSVDLENLTEEIRDAREGAERVRQIVRDLKLFSRTEEDTRGPVDVRRVLDSTLRLAWNEIRHRARVIKAYTDVPAVDGNESRLGQVFLNLIVNAAQAIADGNAGRNEIRVATGVSADGHVLIDIADTGPGIPAHTMSRLFTPFFTTKPVGSGTGLGLSICRRLVTAMGGEITVESTVGVGTAFHIRLPPTRGIVSVMKPAAAPLVASKRGRILVVDDEAGIAFTLRRVLSEEHDVVAMTSATEALLCFGKGDRFDVVLCDLMMPVMGGMDLHAELMQLAPDQAERMIFVSGGAFTVRARNFLDRVANARIEKPFNIDELKAVVNARVG